ncbi:unnamed protein product, partial [Symbiodinium sp. KB8]
TRPNCAIAANGCGDLPPDSEAALTVIGFNLDGDCIVAKITHEHGFEAKGICPVSFLEPTTRPCLSPSFVHKMGELNLVSRCLALLQLAALPWICCSSTSHTTVGLGLLYWWCDYWAGLFANLFALVYWTEGIDNWWQAQAAGLLCGMLVESAAGVIFDLPLKLGKRCCNVTAWALCTWFLGSLWLLSGLGFAYGSYGVAVAGHHALVNGLLMWVLDFLKGVVQTSLYRHFCGSSDRYEPLITELKHPLPEVPEVYQVQAAAGFGQRAMLPARIALAERRDPDTEEEALLRSAAASVAGAAAEAPKNPGGDDAEPSLETAVIQAVLSAGLQKDLPLPPAAQQVVATKLKSADIDAVAQEAASKCSAEEFADYAGRLRGYLAEVESSLFSEGLGSFSKSDFCLEASPFYTIKSYLLLEIGGESYEPYSATLPYLNKPRRKDGRALQGQRSPILGRQPVDL